MKAPNRYAQLVEAQSPEPQEELRMTTTAAATSSEPRESLESDSASLQDNRSDRLSSIATSVESKLSQKASPSAGRHDKRKASQASSQVSTSFLSSTATYSRRSSSVTEVNLEPARAADQQAKNLARTISRSMLELDGAPRVGAFEVYWRRLTFSYRPSWFRRLASGRQTTVLRDVSGRFGSNQLVAVMGPSGCGKTTLLQFLAGNNPFARDRFRIVGLDEPKVAFIGQDDTLLPGLTAWETLLYASRLQNNQPDFDHQAHIVPILHQLGLTECAHRSVTKLSGGQAKRVTIAQELLYPTNLLILDEVTSGLDASTSYSIVKLLKRLVSDTNYPMSIVMSIHQPSARLFSVFDQVYVMADGCCLYEGGCDVDQVNLYLRKFNMECPKYHNIADYLVEVASEDLTTDKTVREQMILHQRKRSDLIQEDALEESKVGVDEEKSPIGDQEELRQQRVSMLIRNDSSLYDAIESARNKRSRPILRHLRVHYARSLLRIRRSYILTYLQLITYILLGLQLATFYGPNIGKLSGCPRLPSNLMTLVLHHETEDDLTQEMRRIQENMNFLLVAVMTATFAALEITVITFPMEAKTVKREWRNGWYRVSSYFMGRTIADLPFQMAFLVVFCVLIYTMTGQIGLTSWRFGSFVTIMVMIALVAQAVGFIFGAMFMDNLPAAVFTAPLCIFPALLFSGFFSRVSQIPPFYKPLTYFSHFRYAFDALLVTLYGYDRCECDQENLTSYHLSMRNQSGTIKVMFDYLFGSNECAQNGAASENSIEDNVVATDTPIASMLNVSTTTPAPSLKFPSIEDVLVDSVFEHINTTTETPASESGGSAMDALANKFSTRITSMLNRQSNYGHEVPHDCGDFNSYLMTEFDLKDESLWFGLVMLLIVVVLTRILCNSILNFTIATRTS